MNYLSQLSENQRGDLKSNRLCCLGWFIYALTNISNGKIYIGRTRNPYQREKQHFISLRANKHHNKEMQADFSKGDLFEFEVISPPSYDWELESKMMKLYETYNPLFGYNTHDPTNPARKRSQHKREFWCSFSPQKGKHEKS